MFSSNVSYLLFPLLCTLGAPTSADSVVRLPELTVNGTIESPVNTADNSTPISRDAIANSKTTNLNGLLQGQNSVQLKQSNASTATGIIIGGASGGLGLITLDGVPMFGTLTGSYSLHHLPADFIQKFTIQRGLGGEHYGSRTLGGAIHLLSRELQENVGYAKFEAGNYGNLRGGIGKAWNTALGNWTTVLERQAINEGYSQADPQNGNTEGDNFQLSSGLLRGRKNFAQGSVDSTLFYSRAREHIDGPGLLANGKFGWVDDLKGIVHNQTWVAQTRVQQQLAKYWLSSVQLGMTRNRQDVQLSTLPYIYTGNLWLLRWQNEHVFDTTFCNISSLKLHWGFDIQQQHGEAISLFGHKNATLTSTSGYLRSESNWNSWQLSAETRFEDHEYFGNKVLFSSKLAWLLSSNMQLWFSGGTGFRPPAVNERLNPLFGKTSLLAESVTNAELGWRWQMADNTQLNLNAVHHDYQQLIVLQSDNTGIRSANVPKAEIWELNISGQYAWNNDWRTGFNYTFMDADNPITSLQIPLRAQHQGNLWQEWNYSSQLQFRVEFNCRDSYWFDQANTQKNTPAPRINILVNYKPTAAIDLYLRGENLNSEHSPEFIYFGYPGITFWGGLKITL